MGVREPVAAKFTLPTTLMFAGGARRFPPGRIGSRLGGEYTSLLFAVDRDLRQFGETKCARSRRCYVHNASPHEGPTVVYRNHNPPSVAPIGNSNL
jgi:hypothetical protein